MDDLQVDIGHFTDEGDPDGYYLLDRAAGHGSESRIELEPDDLPGTIPGVASGMLGKHILKYVSARIAATLGLAGNTYCLS